ncbi:putative DNA topoisomerase III beta-1 [Toxoplasma gondii p89]|uniref:DNA topoisomerase n=1 Tax=Toxoplasma gondii p89 TaxID=943119 RepID=A0A086JJY2_TOXGO|nr:putative DNA topoisomerase III beta-1 [Toxoplasma gondii p89]
MFGFLIRTGKADITAVVTHSLYMFKLKFAYFLKQIERMDMLFEASFTMLAQTGSALSRCGRCNRYMNLITKRPTRLHCRTCNETYNMPQNGAIKLYKELRCPLDNFELVLFTQKGGKSFPLCPLCYNDPPLEGSVTKMSCVECTHPTCKHGIEAVGVLQCPQPDCKGILYLDVVSGPKWKLDCNACQYQVKLMEGAHKISVTPDECDTCGSALLNVVMNKVKPFKDGEVEKTGCFVCDAELNDMVEST